MTRTARALVGAALVSLTAALLPVSSGHATHQGSSGRLLFVVGAHGHEEVVITEPDGSGTTNLSADPARDIDPAWSPDGTKIAWASGRADDGHLDIWVMDADGSDKVNLTPGADTSGDGNAGVEPTWSPSGLLIAYVHQGDVWVVPSSGGQQVNLMPAEGAEHAGASPSYSPEGRIAFIRTGDIWVMDHDGGNATPLTSTPHPAAEKAPDWSPDGGRLVYERQGEIWRMNADGTGQVPVSAGTDKGGTRPEWSPEGDSIVFSSHGYTAPNGPDIFTARPDGTQVVRHRLSTEPNDQSPAWQPLPGGTPWGTYTSTEVRLRKKQVSVDGEVFPADSGEQVRVTLLRKTRKGFKKVEGQLTVLGQYGDFAADLGRPDARKCRVVAKLLASAERSTSKDVTTFAC